MDVYFNAMKIKFDILSNLASSIFDNNHIDSVNFFINLDDINSKFRNVKCNQQFQCCGAGAFKQYASNVFNLAAHYRQWLHRNHAKSRIFIYYTSASCGFLANSIVNGYRKGFAERSSLSNADSYYVNMTINGGTELVKDISKYIDGVYLIDSKGEEPSVIPYLISETHPADWNFILTKDRLELQYCNYDKFSILYPSSRYGHRLINSANLWSFIAEKESISSSHASQYNPKLFNAILGIVGNGVRNVPKVKKIGWRTVFEYLEDIWENNKDHSIETMISELESKISSKNSSALDQSITNALVLNMRSVYNSMSETNKEYILMQLIDIPDIESLNQINRDPMLLGNWPINLQFLTQQSSSFKKKVW